MIQGVQKQKTLPDGRIVCLVQQFYNTMITLGQDETGWSESW
jgi:hypothetical protein